MSIASTAQSLFGNKRRGNDFMNSDNLYGEIDESKQEFNQLKEILREYNPDYKIARANTILRRKKKKLQQQKSRTYSKNELPNVTEGSEENDEDIVNKTKKNTQQVQRHSTHVSDNAHQHPLQRRGRLLTQDEDELTKPMDVEEEHQMIEIKEDVIYFRYNSDGEIQRGNYDEGDIWSPKRKSSLMKEESSTSLHKLMTHKVVGGSHVVEGFNKGSISLSKVDKHHSMSYVPNTPQPNIREGGKFDFNFGGVTSLQTLNHFLANNPDVEYRLENQNSVRQNPYSQQIHKQGTGHSGALVNNTSKQDSQASPEITQSNDATNNVAKSSNLVEQVQNMLSFKEVQGLSLKSSENETQQQKKQKSIIILRGTTNLLNRGDTQKTNLLSNSHTLKADNTDLNQQQNLKQSLTSNINHLDEVSQEDELTEDEQEGSELEEDYNETDNNQQNKVQILLNQQTINSEYLSRQDSDNKLDENIKSGRPLSKRMEQFDANPHNFFTSEDTLGRHQFRRSGLSSLSGSSSVPVSTNSPDQKAYTSFLALNRYNKIHTTEFKEEDIEIMNINSLLSHLNNRLRKVTNIQCVLIFLSFVIFVIDTEIYWNNIAIYNSGRNGDQFTPLPKGQINVYLLCNMLRATNSLVCLATSGLAVYYYRQKARISRIRKFYPMEFWSKRTDYLNPQSLIVQQTYIALIMASKFLILTRVLGFYSPLNSSKGRFITALRGVDYSNTFLIKVWITMNPFKALATCILFFITLNSYLVFLCERGGNEFLISCYTASTRQNSSRILYYKDAVWLTIITLFTVGYGDYYPITTTGRYILIMTAVGGQIYSAIVIGLVHSQIMLTSEESGVLNIISNNRREKTKKMIAATLIYYLLKLAVIKSKLLQKGNIHWHKTRQVHNIKFELYVFVMKFKKIKHLLASYYATRGNDSNLSKIKNTETQLALLAAEVITIFEYFKDSKLERKKNIDSSIKRGQSMIQHVIEEEINSSKQAKGSTQGVANGNNGVNSTTFENINNHSVGIFNANQSLGNMDSGNMSLFSNNLGYQQQQYATTQPGFNKSKTGRPKILKQENLADDKFVQAKNGGDNLNYNNYTKFGIQMKFSENNNSNNSNQNNTSSHTIDIRESSSTSSQGDEKDYNDELDAVSSVNTQQLRNQLRSQQTRVLSLDYSDQSQGMLTKKLEERKEQQRIQRRITSITQSVGGPLLTAQTKRSSYQNLSKWKDVVNVGHQRTTSCDDFTSHVTPSLFKRVVLAAANKYEKTSKSSSNLSQNHEDIHSQLQSVKGQGNQSNNQDKVNENNNPKLQKEQQKQSNLKNCTSNIVDEKMLKKRHNTQAKIYSPQRIIDTNKLKDMNSPQKMNQGKSNTLYGIKSQASSNQQSSHKRRSSIFAKSNTLISQSNTQGNGQGSIHGGGGFGNLQQNLKAQRTQLHPTMNSIVEEEETYSDDESQGFQIEEDLDEDNDSNQNSFEPINTPKLSQDLSNKLQIDEQLQYKLLLNEQLQQKQQKQYEEEKKELIKRLESQVDQRSSIISNTLSQVLDDIKIQQDIIKSFSQITKNSLKSGQQRNQNRKISVNSLQIPDVSSLSENTQDDLDNITANYNRKHSLYSSLSANPLVNKQEKQLGPRSYKMSDDQSFFVSEDQKSNSFRGTPRMATNDDVSNTTLYNNNFSLLHPSSAKQPKNMFHSNSSSQSQNNQGDKISNKSSDLMDGNSLLQIPTSTPKPQLQDNNNPMNHISPTNSPNIKQVSFATIVNLPSMYNGNKMKFQSESSDHFEINNVEHQELFDSYQNNDIQILELIKKLSSEYNFQISEDQRASLQSIQDQVNNKMQNQQQKQLSPKIQDSKPNQLQQEEEQKAHKQEDNNEKYQKETLRTEIHTEEAKVSSLAERIGQTEQLFEKIAKDARAKFQKLKEAAGKQPTLQVNVINNVNPQNQVFSFMSKNDNNMNNSNF